MTIKEALYKQCLEFVNEKLVICNTQISKIQESLQSETKSTAGDKHETGRAMLQLEREKLGQQLETVEQLKITLSKIDTSKSNNTVCLGSVVYTTQNNYFMAISAGEIKLDNCSFYAISPNTPIGKLVLGKTTGDTFSFRGSSFVITSVE